MPLQKKILIMSFAAASLALLTLYVTAHFFILNNFKSLEHEQTVNNMQRVILSLKSMEEQMAQRSFDYAAWDDTYNYIQLPDKHKDYEQANLTEETLVSNQFYTLILVNKKKEVIFQQAINEETKKLERVSPSLVEMAQSDQSYLYSPLKQARVSGLIHLPEGPMLVVSQPITKNHASSPPAGYWIAGRYLNQKVIDQLKRENVLSVELTKLEEAQKSQESIYSSSIWNSIERGAVSTTFAALPGLDGKPAVTFRLASTQPIYNQGKKSILIFLLLLGMAISLIVLISLYFLNKTVVRRIHRLKNNMIRIQESKDLSERVEVSGNDEIGSLEKEFNTMLDSLEEYKDRIVELAYRDSLTDLPNRTYFYEEINRKLEKLKKKKHLGAVLFIDLDGFKQVNDTLGHDQGDLLLKKIAEIFKSVVREKDIVARLGGDEFLVYLADLNKKEAAECVANRICRLISQPIDLNGHEVQLSASIGISFVPQDGYMPEELIKKADQAMYEAKRTGKNKLYIFNDKAASKGADRL